MGQRHVSHHNLYRWHVLALWWCFSGGSGPGTAAQKMVRELMGRELLCVEWLGTAFCFMTGGMAISSSIKSCLPSHVCHLGPVTVNYGKVKAKSHLVCCTGDDCRTTSVSRKPFIFLIAHPPLIHPVVRPSRLSLHLGSSSHSLTETSYSQCLSFQCHQIMMCLMDTSVLPATAWTLFSAVMKL